MRQVGKKLLGRFWLLQVVGVISLWVSAAGSGFYDWADSNYYRGLTNIDGDSGFFYFFPKMIYFFAGSDANYIIFQLLLSTSAILYLFKGIDSEIFDPRILMASKIFLWSLFLSPFFAPWQGLVLSEGLFLSFEVIIIGSFLKYLRTPKIQYLCVTLFAILILIFTRPISVFVLIFFAFSLSVGLFFRKDLKLFICVMLIALIAAFLGLKTSSYDPQPTELTWMDDAYRSLQLGIESSAYLEQINRASKDDCTVDEVTYALYNIKFENLKVSCPSLYNFVNSRDMMGSRVKFIIQNPVSYLKTPTAIASTIPNFYSKNAFVVLPDGVLSLFSNSVNSNYKINSGEGNRLNAPIVIWILISFCIAIMSWYKKLYFPLVISILGITSLIAILFLVQLPGVAEPGRHPIPLLFLFYISVILSAGILSNDYDRSRDKS